MKNKNQYPSRTIFSLIATMLSPVAAVVGSAAAQTTAVESSVAEASQVIAVLLNPITVTATKVEQLTSDVAATVSVISEKDREKTLANDIRDLIKYEPGISVRSSPSRFTAAGSGLGRDGNSGFNIRGIDGNNILIQSDGVRLPLAFGFGASNFGRGDYIDIEAYKSVELLRGPASTLYGSDGLAGAVSFISKDPADFLSKNMDAYFALKGVYASADDSHATSLTAAHRVGALELMALITKRGATETENKGSNESPNLTRTAANPQQIASDYVLAKVVYNVNAKSSVKLTAEQLERGVRTNVLTARANAPLTGTSVIDLHADDEITRRRMSLDYRFAGEANDTFNTINVSLYGQRSGIDSRNAEDRNMAADRRRDNIYREKANGINASFVHEFRIAGFDNRLVYGGDYSKTKVVSIRDGLVPPAGETFPTKPFPDTDYSLSGLFIQDEFLIGDRFSLIPGLRFDRYQLAPQSGDPQFPSASTPANLSGSKVTPKFGVIFRFTPTLSTFVQLAEGFRAPTPAQVNNGFTNQISNYQSIANSNLKAETSRSVEVGIRGAANTSINTSWEVVAFDSRYKDFISQVQTAGDFTPTNPALFQFRNLGTVKISGVEAKCKLQLDSGVGLFGNIAYAKGDDTGTNQPLETIDPLKAVLGAAYTQEKFSVQLVGQFTRAKAASRVSTPDPRTGASAFFLSPASTIFDMQGAYAFSKTITLNWAVNNITNKKYWVWADVRGQSAASAVLDSFTQPGRNYAASIKVAF
jgi:hemoglobin/transferrin/lactoferrin receptor protein